VFKAYRVIYRVMGDEVFVYLVVNGRHEMSPAFARRSLGA
jgi:toxin ParE1/3/4